MALEQVKFTNLKNEIRQAVALDKLKFDENTKVLTAYSSLNENIKEEVNIGNDGDVTDVQVNGTSVVTNGVANVPIASSSAFGAVKVNESNGVAIDQTGLIYTNLASTDQIKNGSNNYRVIVPYNQHTSTFYGLAKAAGDSTQSASNNAVGTYTDGAKTSIRTMLEVPSTNVATTSANGLMSSTDKSHLDVVYADYSSALAALGVI